MTAKKKRGEKVIPQGEFNTAANPQTLKQLNHNQTAAASCHVSVETGCILVFHFVFPYYSLFQLLQRLTPIRNFEN